jgi:ligand-binding SRPBCC domain-containing protein
MERLVWATPEAVFERLARVGYRGRYPGSEVNRALWSLRSLLAPALVRGRAPTGPSSRARGVGNWSDHWHVAEFDEGRRLTLACEMRGLGEARLAWTIEPRPGGRCLLRQTAGITDPTLAGRVYWSVSALPHAALFGSLLRSVAHEAERDGTGPPETRPSRGLRIIRREIVVPRPLAETFEFFADASNLEAITPEWLHFEILTKRPIRMGVGTLIDYRIRLHAIPVHWHTRIDVWEPGVRFVDRQLRGPYRWWHHEHRFEAVERGTRVIDEVEYASPLRWLSEPLIVKRDVTRIFDERASRLRMLLATR